MIGFSGPTHAGELVALAGETRAENQKAGSRDEAIAKATAEISARTAESRSPIKRDQASAMRKTWPEVARDTRFWRCRRQWPPARSTTKRSTPLVECKAERSGQ